MKNFILADPAIDADEYCGVRDYEPRSKGAILFLEPRLIMSRTIELTDETYAALARAAQNRGLSVTELLETSFRSAGLEHVRLYDLMQGLIGIIDSRDADRGERTPFSELVARKLERQGLRRS
jgi:hypothetical protein